MIKTNLKLKTLFAALMLSGVATLSGCSSLAIGESEFQCQAEEGGVACISAREVYQKTHTKDHLTDKDLAPGVTIKKENDDSFLGYFNSNDENDKKAVPSVPAVNYNGISGSVYDSENEVIKGYIDGKDTIELYRHSESKIEELKQKHDDGTFIEPNLLRQPAQVMRVWIGPREDMMENFHKPQEVYVEIESKKWLLGNKVKFERPVIRPLLRESSSMNKSYNGANAGKNSPVNSFKQPSTPNMSKEYQQWK